VPEDLRLTTRYREDDFVQSLMGTIHETGHARFEQNLPREWLGQPVGNSRGMTLHESQSLLLEMQASRSEEFIRFLVPLIKRVLGGSGPAWVRKVVSISCQRRAISATGTGSTSKVTTVCTTYQL